MYIYIHKSIDYVYQNTTHFNSKLNLHLNRHPIPGTLLFHFFWNFVVRWCKVGKPGLVWHTHLLRFSCVLCLWRAFLSFKQNFLYMWKVYLIQNNKWKTVVRPYIHINTIHTPTFIFGSKLNFNFRSAT